MEAKEKERIDDVLGRAVDTAENYMEYGTHATKALYLELGGEDVWA